MESKAARIQQWLRDLRLPSLRSWSNIDVSSVSSQDHLEELELNPKTFEDIATPWNTDQDSIKKWKSSQNLSLVTHDKESHNEWFKMHSSQEEIRDDCTSEESIPSSLTPSTQSLHEIYHLQHYFTRTMKLKPTQPNSPRHRNRLSASDPDFRFYEVNSYQQDTSWTPQSSSSIEILNTVHSCSKKNVSFHRTSSSRKMYIQEKYPKLKLKNSLRFRQFPIARPKVVETQHHSLKRRLPYPPQNGKDHSLSPPPLVTKVNYQGTESYLSQKSTQSVDLGYDSLPTCDMYHSTHSSVRDKGLQYSQNIRKYQHFHKHMPQVSMMPSEDVYFHKTIHMSTLKYIRVIKRTGGRLPLAPHEVKYHRQVYFDNSQMVAKKQTWEI